MSTSNPVLSNAVFERCERVAGASNVMTLQGTVIKTGVLLAVLMLTATYTWTQASANPGLARTLMIVGCIGGFILALITSFRPSASPITSPIYAALEGLAMGGISAMYEAAFPGIVLNAIGLSVGTLLGMLALYGSGIVKATEKFKAGVLAATCAVGLVYLLGMILSFFGTQIPYIHQTGMIGIAFSGVVVVIAALNLVLDFDFIEQGVRQQAPHYMEWYGGFGLLVTLVWMYLEILRLLSKLQSRD